MLQGKISSDIASKRQQCINSFKKFLEEQQTKLQNVLEQLDLKLPPPTKISEIEHKQVCPYNKDHVIPEKSFKKHCERCRLKTTGLQEDELEVQLQDLDFAYKDTNCEHKVEIDEKTLNKVIWDSCVQNGQVYTGHRKLPRNHIEENTDLTQEDRLALYHYIVKKSREEGKVLSVDTRDELLTTDWGSLVKKGLLDKQNNENYSSKLEQLAALRDMKRRRQSYRAKNVHITKKSYTEIIREVIVNQMEILVPDGNDQLQPDVHDSRLDVNESDRSSHSRNGRDRDRSTALRGEYEQKGEKRSRSRDRSAHWSSTRERSRVIKVESREEILPRDAETTSSSRSNKKRRRRSSSLDSESNNERAGKHKKSKHKKKHSKKHKRKD